MMKKTAAIVGLAFLLIYTPVWWAMVFSGYYDTLMSEEAITTMKWFVPSDVFLFITFGIMLVGLRKRAVYAYLCGTIICGAILYITIHSIAMIAAGALPNDPALHLVLWPYLIAAAFGLILVHKDLSQRLEATMGEDAK